MVSQAIKEMLDGKYESGELVGTVFTLTEIQRLILRLLLHRGEPLPTGVIRLGLASFLWKYYKVPSKKLPTANRDAQIWWEPDSYERASIKLEDIRAWNKEKAVPSYNGLETQLSALENKGFLIRISTSVKVENSKQTKKAQRAKALWSLNPKFVKEYFEKKTEVNKNYELYPPVIQNFFEITETYKDAIRRLYG